MSKMVGFAARPIMERVKSRVDPRVFNGACINRSCGGSVIKKPWGSRCSGISAMPFAKTLTEISNDVPSRIQHEISAAAGAAV